MHIFGSKWTTVAVSTTEQTTTYQRDHNSGGLVAMKQAQIISAYNPLHNIFIEQDKILREDMKTISRSLLTERQHDSYTSRIY